MKTTNSKIVEIIKTRPTKDGYTCHAIGLSIVLTDDDLKAVEEVILPELNATTQTEHDLADCLLTCLTYGIHKAWEDAQGVPWTLRMDRKSNKA